MSQTIHSSEADILSRVMSPEGMTPEAARAILTWRFPAADIARMNELSAKASAGTLSENEQTELDNYERVGHLIAVAQSKSRTILRQSENVN